MIYSVLSFLTSKPRSAAPHTPRVILLGATGSGKGVQAALLANRYNIVNGKDNKLSPVNLQPKDPPESITPRISNILNLAHLGNMTLEGPT